MNTYRAWQCNSKLSLSDNIYQAIQNYISKYGIPAQILEVSDQLDESIVPPAEMKLVIKVVRIPKNILLLGVDDGLVD